MTDKLREFCEDNCITCTINQEAHGPVEVELIHNPSGRLFTDKFPFMSEVYINSLMEKAKYLFNLVDVASLYPKFYMSPEWAKLRKRLISAEMRAKRPEIEKVIFNDPATVVLWSDGTKTVVKAENEAFDPEKGLAMAISKKFLGNKGNYYETFKEWLPEEKEEEDEIISTLEVLSDGVKLSVTKLGQLENEKKEENDVDEAKRILANLSGGSVDDSLYTLITKLLFSDKSVVNEKAIMFTWGHIFDDFKDNYPEFVDDVADWRPYLPPYASEERPMNIIIWMKNDDIKRYSYKTKRLYPVRDEESK